MAFALRVILDSPPKTATVTVSPSTSVAQFQALVAASVGASLANCTASASAFAREPVVLDASQLQRSLGDLGLNASSTVLFRAPQRAQPRSKPTDEKSAENKADETESKSGSKKGGKQSRKGGPVEKKSEKKADEKKSASAQNRFEALATAANAGSISGATRFRGLTLDNVLAEVGKRLEAVAALSKSTASSTSAGDSKEKAKETASISAPASTSAASSNTSFERTPDQSPLFALSLASRKFKSGTAADDKSANAVIRRSVD